MKSLPVLLLAPFFLSASSSSAAPKTAAPPAAWPGWMPMPLLPPAAKAAGVFPGGEGSQWPRGPVVVSKSDPNFLLLPIDVGGLYASHDGGAHWKPAMNGWNARGANGFAIDPRNAKHVLGVAGNSMNWDKGWGMSPHGVYRSNDGAASWKQTLAAPDLGGFSPAFDPSSFDKTSGICMRAYFLSVHDGLFVSEDGGTTWKGLARTTRLGNGFLRADDAGTVYVGGSAGLWRSTDRGATWKQSRTQPIAGLDLGALPNVLYVSGDDGLSISRDGGTTFAPLAAKGVERSGKAILNITVSPADAKRMLCWVQGDNYQWVRYVSDDGGATFAPIKVERGQAGRDDGTVSSVPGGYANLPLNVREGKFAWSPTNPNLVYGIGGDWVTRSTDGGHTFKWWNNGYNGIMLGSSFNFAAQDPAHVFLAFQDYNTADTKDGGATWTYHDASGKGWGGHCYGAGQTTGGVYWYGDADDWGGKRRLRISFDAGATWDFAKTDGQVCAWDGAEVSFTSPRNDAVLFASNWRSADKGKTWAKMEGCDGVFISAADGRLFGRKGSALVQSKDDGATWDKVADVPGGFADVAFDAKRNRFYFASEGRLKRLDDGKFSDVALPRDQMGNGPQAVTVAVDADAPDVVYAGGPRNLYASHATVVRSRDGGATWENLTTGDGPHEVAWIRVHPLTGQAWLNGQCYGMWRIARPTTLGAADPKHGDAPRMLAVASVADLKPAPPAAVRDPDEPKITDMVADFGGRNFDYAYGDIWKVGQNVTTGDDEGTGFVQLDTTEHGGAGLVLNGANLQPGGQTHLALRARLLDGNAAGLLSVNLNRADADGGGKSVTFDLSKLRADKWTTLLVPLPAGEWTKVQQVQIQGTNWNPEAKPLRVQIDAFGTTTPDAR